MGRKRAINKKETDELLLLKGDNITLDKLKELFANTKNSKAKFNTNDTFILPAKKLRNQKNVNTTVGRYIFNLFVIGDELGEHIEYINKPMDKGEVKKLDGIICNLLISDDITPEIYINYLDRIQWLGFGISNFLSPSLTYDMLEPPKKVKDKKKELIKKYETQLNNNDIFTANKMEEELLKLSKEELRDLPDMEIYDSGCRGSFGNNYKQTSLMRGAMRNSRTGEFTVSTSNLMEGIPKEEWHNYADKTVEASYSRAIGTREGGYEGKKLSAAFQNIVLGDRGSDCGTQKTIKVTITKNNKNEYIDRYIIQRKKSKLLSMDNIDSYIGKTVDMRSPMYCTNDNICNICAGELYYKIGIKNVGLLTKRVGTRMLNLSLKKFHDTSVKVVKLDINKYIEIY